MRQVPSARSRRGAAVARVSATGKRVWIFPFFFFNLIFPLFVPFFSFLFSFLIPRAVIQWLDGVGQVSPGLGVERIRGERI